MGQKMWLLMQAGGEKCCGAEEKEENRAECHFSNKYTAGVAQQTKKKGVEIKVMFSYVVFGAAGGVSEATVE